MRLLAFAFGLLALLATAVLADERITSFQSDVTVNADASLSVRETISVISENDQIRHGIYRDFPTTYPDRNGQRVIVGLDVLGVRRDGHDEPYAIESISNGKRIRIGDKDVLVDNGPHVYEITYRASRELGFFKDYDELYWNVTGNGWVFPIDKVKANIVLPAGAHVIQHAEYTGHQGDTGKDADASASDNQYSVETTRALGPSEGLTVAVAWPKGIVTPPTDSQKWNWWLADNAGLFVLLASLYYLYAWTKVGRDPPAGTIIPLFAPPEGLGPAGVRFVSRYGADGRTFAAAMVGLAVKGRMKIADDASGFTVTKLPAPAKAAPLTRSEQALYDALPMGSTALKQTNHAAVGAAKSALETTLSAQYEGSVFRRNLGWFGGGLALSLIGLVAGALLLPAEDGVMGLFAVGWAALWWGVIFAIGWRALKGFSAAGGIFSKIGSLFTLLFLIPFVGAGLAGPVLLLTGTGSPALYWLVAAAVALGFMNVLFFYLLRAPTEPGRRLLDQIEGFRLYLSTAEEERLNLLNPPEKTPELFERYLPYALALDCENQWNAKFAAVLAAAAAAGATAPLWYSGNNWNAGRTGAFTNSLGSSLAASAASAATAPGSSSGSGGGGSSGGGGGGGGGGGW